MHAQEQHLRGMYDSANRLAYKASLHSIPRPHQGPKNVILRKDGEPLMMKVMHYANEAQRRRGDDPTKLVHVYRGMSNVIIKERRSAARRVARIEAEKKAAARARARE